MPSWLVTAKIVKATSKTKRLKRCFARTFNSAIEVLLRTSGLQCSPYAVLSRCRGRARKLITDNLRCPMTLSHRPTKNCYPDPGGSSSSAHTWADSLCVSSSFSYFALLIPHPVEQQAVDLN